MNVQLLIDAIVRQTTVLVAELATAGGARAPLAHVANQVFMDLAAELERQGVSRKVSADMFGLALRSYQRKVARLRESSTMRGQSLWEAVLEFLTAQSVATRAEVLRHFHADPEDLVSGVLHDLAESGVIFSSGRGVGTLYRAISTDELSRIPRDDEASLDAMVWAIVYRLGPSDRDTIAKQAHVASETLDGALERLEKAGRIDVDCSGPAPIYSSAELVIAEGAKVGWEAAVFDHFQAVVRTVVQKLRQADGDPDARRVGGSTYTFVVWPGHPLYDEAAGELAEFRRRKGELRARIDEYNRAHGIPAAHEKVIAYFGQSITREEGNGEPNES